MGNNQREDLVNDERFIIRDVVFGRHVQAPTSRSQHRASNISGGIRLRMFP
tara:strand:- start:30779 stop:30931 length:153 start_codon:yes stop_codon:yes gene_type:complete